MPSKITVRYFQVNQSVQACQPFSEALRDVAELTLLSRTRVVGDTYYRLERFEEDRRLILGQITRIQDDNLPAKVTEVGLQELDATSLGYGAAFVFDPRTSVLAIQYNTQLVTPGRLGLYLSAFSEYNKYSFLPIPGEDTWDTFMDGDITSFRLKVARPANFAFQGPGEMEHSIGALARAYEAPYVTITLGVGHKKTTLGVTLKDVARRLMGREAVESMKAKVADHPESIDLMAQMLHDKDSITIPSDPVRSYEIRRNFVDLKYREKRAYIRAFLDAQETD